MPVLAIGFFLTLIVSRGRQRNDRVPIVPQHYKVDREIAQSVRLSTDRQQVLDYCKQRNWNCSDQGSKMVAIDQAADQRVVFPIDVVITFDFDSSGKLRSFHSEDRRTGP